MDHFSLQIKYLLLIVYKKYNLIKMMTEKTCDNFICTDPKFEFNLQTDILLDIIWKSMYVCCIMYNGYE